MSRAGRWARNGALLAGGAFLVFLAVFALDMWRHEGRVARNVMLEGVAVGGMPLDELDGLIASTATAYAEAPVSIQMAEGQIDHEANQVGFSVDQDATGKLVRSTGRIDGFLGDLWNWAGRFLDASDVESVVAYDDSVAHITLEDDSVAFNLAPREPSIRFDGDHLQLDTGEPGRELDVEGTLIELAAMGPPAVIETGGETVVAGRWESRSTVVSPGDAVALFTTLERHTKNGLFVFGVGGPAFISRVQLSSWLSGVSIDGAFEIVFDESSMDQTIEEVLGDWESGEIVVAFEIVDGVPVPLSAEDGRQVCCDPSLTDLLKTAVTSHVSEQLVAPLRGPTQAESDEAVEKMGIVEEIGTFTTFHRCCAGRVTNIHRIADITRGVIIEPGGSFSVNTFVGKRTRANGFVDGGVIYQGRFESDVGGGISQYATTLFNAAFFGAMDIQTYQSHSIYLDRYPYGREATLSFPEPDLAIHNPTDYAVLIWPTYDATSITVTLYSTKVAEVTDIGQNVDSWKSCTRVTTWRERLYEDGTVVEDYVFALYRPSAGYDCDGLPEIKADS